MRLMAKIKVGSSASYEAPFVVSNIKSLKMKELKGVTKD